MSEKFDYIEHYKKDSEEFDYFEKRYGATEDDERRVHEFILSKIDKNCSSILDVGSGSAWLAKKFQNQNKNMISLDLSKINVQKAKKLIPDKYHLPVVADSFHLPFPQDLFDVVVASEIIEHVLDPSQFVKEMIRVIKPGGKVIVTTPYKEKLRFYLCVHCNQKTPVNAHIHSFDESKLISYSPSESDWHVFGNKILIYSRSYIILRYFPFWLWRLLDNIFNSIYRRPLHIIMEYYK